MSTRLPAPPAAGLAPFLPPAAVLVAAAVLSLLSPGRLNHDCALYLQCAQLLLEGQRPYLDFVDLNPPFIFYLNLVPVALSGWLWTPLALTFTLCVLAIAAWSTFAIQRSLARDPVWGAFAVPIATLWAAYSFVIRSSNDFGQREHLLLLLYVPYAVSRALGAAEAPHGGRGRRFPRLPWRGLAAGVAVCIKPQYLLVALAVELGAWAVKRAAIDLRDPERRALLVAPLLYALHFAFLPAAVRDALFGRWLPLIAARYSVYDLPAAEFFHTPTLAAGLFGLAVFVVALRRRRPEDALPGVLGAFVASGVAVYLLQHKGWPYHQMPVTAATALLLALLTGRWLRNRVAAPAAPRGLPRYSTSIIAVAVGVAWMLVASRLPLPLVDPPGWEQPLATVVREFSDRGDPVLVVSSGVHPAYPALLQTDRRPGSRYLWFFTIPMLASEARARGASGADARPATARGSRAWLDAEERRFLEDLRQDLAARNPPIVVVSTERGAQGSPPDFTALGYLERHGLVQAIARDRERLPEIEGLEGLAIFVAVDRLRR